MTLSCANDAGGGAAALPVGRLDVNGWAANLSTSRDPADAPGRCSSRALLPGPKSRTRNSCTELPSLPRVRRQQIDLRTSNSWLLKMGDVSTPELVEVFAINTLAPFLLNARLQPLLAATATMGPPSASGPAAAFIVNVSAMEGKFYRHKTPNHPHTNMAKAALNMMTRTSAAELAASHRIFMTAVDTGWINDENPRDRAAQIGRAHV